MPSNEFGAGAAPSPNVLSSSFRHDSAVISMDAIPKRCVLVVGCGPAGSSTAYWLGEAGFEVLVAERTTAKQYGQGLDITGPGLEIVRKMGLEDTIRSRTTKEGGFKLVDDRGKAVAIFGVRTASGNPPSFTNEIETMRGELTDTLARAAEAMPKVTYRNRCSVSEMRQSEKSVTGVPSDNGEAEELTAIIGADGVGSKVRRLIFDSEVNKDCLKPTDTYEGVLFNPWKTRT